MAAQAQPSAPAQPGLRPQEAHGAPRAGTAHPLCRQKGKPRRKSHPPRLGVLLGREPRARPRADAQGSPSGVSEPGPVGGCGRDDGGSGHPVPKSTPGPPRTQAQGCGSHRPGPLGSACRLRAGAVLLVDRWEPCGSGARGSSAPSSAAVPLTLTVAGHVWDV